MRPEESLDGEQRENLVSVGLLSAAREERGLVG